MRRLILNANGDPARFSSFGLPVIADTVEKFPGAARRHSGGARLGRGEPARRAMGAERRRRLPVPAARPRRAAACGANRGERAARVAASDGQSHPVIGLWSVALRGELRHALVDEDIRKIDRWTARYPLATVEWQVDELDPFFNANTMDDIAEAERLAALDGGEFSSSSRKRSARMWPGWSAAQSGSVSRGPGLRFAPSGLRFTVGNHAFRNPAASSAARLSSEASARRNACAAGRCLRAVTVAKS